MQKKEQCPFCGKRSYGHQTKSMMIEYKGHEITLKQPGYWCDACGEAVIGGEDKKATKKILQNFRAKIDGLLMPDDIKRIRQKLHLSQKQASDIFGGGVNAFSRYERGETSLFKATSQLLKILDHHPEQLREVVSQ